MRIKTYQGRTMLDLLSAAKRDLGPLAVFLSVRKVEVLAADGVHRIRLLEGSAAADDPQPGSSPEALPAAPGREAAARPATPAQARREPPPAPGPDRETRGRAAEIVVDDHFGESTAREAQPRNELEEQESDPASRPLREAPRGGWRAWLQRLAGSSAPGPRLVARAQPQILVLLGPRGAGKTSAAAKVARHLRERTGAPVGLISIQAGASDASGILSRFSQEHKVPLVIVRSASELRQVVERWGDRGPLVVDTPATGPEECHRMAKISRIIQAFLPQAEIHLVLDASRPHAESVRNLKAFQPCGYRQILLTHVDADQQGALHLAKAVGAHVPLSFLASGTGPQDLKAPQPPQLAGTY